MEIADHHQNELNYQPQDQKHNYDINCLKIKNLLQSRIIDEVIGDILPEQTQIDLKFSTIRLKPWQHGFQEDGGKLLFVKHLWLIQILYLRTKFQIYVFKV